MWQHPHTVHEMNAVLLGGVVFVCVAAGCAVSGACCVFALFSCTSARCWAFLRSAFTSRRPVLSVLSLSTLSAPPVCAASPPDRLVLTRVRCVVTGFAGGWLHPFMAAVSSFHAAQWPLSPLLSPLAGALLAGLPMRVRDS